MSRYDSLFFDYVDAGALRSAKIFTELLRPEIALESVLDVGCGRGGWAASWKAAGCSDVVGVDGDYVDRATLKISPAEFTVRDLNKPFDLERTFDLVQSLEVAEHLRPETSAAFVNTLVRHGDIVLFSAAVPGQGGTTHINERPIEFWRGLFRERGYEAYDFIRPLIKADESVEPWYRFNTVLYIADRGLSRVSEAVKAARVPANQRVTEGGSAGWRARRMMVRWLPRPAVDRLAVINATLTARSFKPRA